MANYTFDGVFDLDEALSMPFIPENTTIDVFVPSPRDEEVMALNFAEVITSKESQCSVCMEKFEESQKCTTQLITCGHVYHTHCITTWLCVRANCPLCRVKVTRESQNKI
ncbi:hypothetical protein vseg_000147 [Gypsophila vaccaria]